MLWHTLWSESYSNPRYAELVPRLRDLFFAPIRQRSGLAGRIDGGIARRTRNLERRTLNWYQRRGLRLLLTPSPWQAPLFQGPVVVDLDDPTRSTSEQKALTARNIACVVVPTNLIAQYVRESSPRARVTVVPQGVNVAAANRGDHTQLRHRLLARSARPAQTVIVGYHAPIICVSTDPDYQDPRFRMYYVDVLLTAVQRLWNQGIDFLTVLVGQTSPTIRKLAWFERRLVLTGYVDRAELFDWVGGFDIGTYPRTVDFSRGQSAKLLDYMASDAAIVAMMSSETSYLRDAALGAVVDEADGFCSALRELITDPDIRRTFANRGREFIAAHDWNRLAARYEAIIADAIESA